MKTYVAFLRGINVSGQKRIPMAELRELLAKTGLSNIETYIQSGNVIFQSSEKSKENLESQIHNAIKSHFGFEVPVLILNPKELKQIFNACPFPENQKTESYFMLLFESAEGMLVNEISNLSNSNETFQITDSCIYFYSAIGYGKSKFNNNFFEKKLKITATARNYKTMVKLLSLLADK
jgi:uncharacterized protein (DUF1697 family)